VSYTSKYAQKRQKALCCAPQCDVAGTALRLIEGRPFWICAQHAQQLDDTLEKSR